VIQLPRKVGSSADDDPPVSPRAVTFADPETARKAVSGPVHNNGYSDATKSVVEACSADHEKKPPAQSTWI
jgi:hypothetical protein